MAVGLALTGLLTIFLAGCGSSAVRRVKVPRTAYPVAPVMQRERLPAPTMAKAKPAAPLAAAQPQTGPITVTLPAAPPLHGLTTVPDGYVQRGAFGTVTVVNPNTRPRLGEALSFGLPLSQGQAVDVSELLAWMAHDGSDLPIQARALSRWPDGSLRWVLIDTVVDLSPRARRTVAVGPAGDSPAPAEPASDPWVLKTLEGGGLAASDGTQVWTLWQPAGPSRQGDLVAGFSARLSDRFGHLYDGFVDPETAVILEQGPRRLSFSIEGTHRSRDGAGLPIDFHRFWAVVHLVAGGGPARIEWSLSNGPLEQPPGPMAFTAYDLLLDVPEAPRQVLLDGHTLRDAGVADLIQLGTKARLLIGGKAQPTPRRGNLWMGVRGLDGDVFVQRVDSEENHPAGLRCGASGPLTMGLLPTLSGREYFLDDATRKTFRIDLLRNVGKDGPELLAQLSVPIQVIYNPSEIAASKAWGDAGLLYLPDPNGFSAQNQPPRDPPTGWADWGEANSFNTHQTGSPRNRLSVYLEALQSGRDDLFRWAEARAWHAMDLRPYHIDGFLASEHPDANLYEGIPHSNEPPSRRLGRSEIPGRFPEYKTGLPEKGHNYNGFDPEHMTLDDVYECWLLSGSWQALDALRSAGEAMLTWKEVIPNGDIHSARSFGWTLRALVQVYRATGEARYIDAARLLVSRADAERGKGPVKYMQRMKADSRHMADQESESPFMVAVALHGLSAYWHETADPLVPPMAADLSDFCMSAFRGTGFAADMPLDGPSLQGQADSPLGVSAWIPGGLAAAAFITGDHSAVDRTRGYYAQLHGHSKAPVSFGGKDWHWWQPWLVSVDQRHGRQAVDHPGN